MNPDWCKLPFSHGFGLSVISVWSFFNKMGDFQCHLHQSNGAAASRLPVRQHLLMAPDAVGGVPARNDGLAVDVDRPAA